VITYCHVEGKDGISHKRKRVASVGTLRPIAKGENEACKEKAHVGIIENRVDQFDRLSANDRRVLEGVCQDKERDEEVTLNNTEQDKSGERKFDQVDGKCTRAIQEKNKLKVW
jgi:hypothetical protein